MSKREKLLDKWRRNAPTAEPVDKVLAVIDHFFAQAEVNWQGGSHIIIEDQRLKGIDGFDALGHFEIPVRGGQKVIGKYLERLVKAIDILAELEDLNDEPQ
jgi:hypothetical protein